MQRLGSSYGNHGAMEAMGPPSFVDDLFPRHLPEVMVRLGFHGWPEEERRSVVSCLTAVGRCLELSQRGRDEWSEAMGLLDESAAPGA